MQTLSVLDSRALLLHREKAEKDAAVRIPKPKLD
jgi:hypothetical protein